jgi:hypothetical protein
MKIIITERQSKKLREYSLIPSNLKRRVEDGDLDALDHEIGMILTYISDHNFSDDYEKFLNGIINSAIEEFVWSRKTDEFFYGDSDEYDEEDEKRVINLYRGFSPYLRALYEDQIKKAWNKLRK